MSKGITFVRNRIAHPPFPRWASGRFYDSNVKLTGLTTQTHGGGDLHAVPLWVPEKWPIQAIGCEITGLNGGTGATARFAVYSSIADEGIDDQQPWALICETGIVAMNSVAFKSDTPAFEPGWDDCIPQGLVWLCDVGVTTDNTPSLRSIGNASDPPWMGGGWPANGVDAANALLNRVASSYRVGSQGPIVTNGYPKRFPMFSAASNNFNLDNSTTPRVMVQA